MPGRCAPCYGPWAIGARSRAPRSRCTACGPAPDLCQLGRWSLRGRPAAPAEQEPGLGRRCGQGETECSDRPALLAGLQALSVSADFLASGALVVTVPASGSAVDQTTQAARAVVHQGTVAKRAGHHGDWTRRCAAGTAVGEVVNRSSACSSPNRPAAKREVGMPACGSTRSAPLLDGRFERPARRGASAARDPR